MPLEMRQFSCPQCGSGLEVKNTQRAKSIVCQSCGSQIDLSSAEYAVIGQTILNSAPPRTPVALGLSGEFDGQRYQAIGRVRYREDEYMWDEWLLMTEDGQFKWLTEGEKGFTLYEAFAPTNPVAPASLQALNEGDEINLEGTTARIGDRGTGRIDYLEGELTWRARVGDEVNYADAEFSGGRYSIEWTPEEIEFYRGKNLSNNEVRRAFGLADEPTPGFFSRMRRVAIWTMVLIVICVCFVGFVTVAGGGNISLGAGDGSGSIRTSSSGGHSVGGGGSSGGGGK